jgi:hypothetical protein
VPSHRLRISLLLAATTMGCSWYMKKLQGFDDDHFRDTVQLTAVRGSDGTARGDVVVETLSERIHRDEAGTMLWLNEHQVVGQQIHARLELEDPRTFCIAIEDYVGDGMTANPYKDLLSFQLVTSDGLSLTDAVRTSLDSKEIEIEMHYRDSDTGVETPGVSRWLHTHVRACFKSPSRDIATADTAWIKVKVGANASYTMNLARSGSAAAPAAEAPEAPVPPLPPLVVEGAIRVVPLKLVDGSKVVLELHQNGDIVGDGKVLAHIAGGAIRTPSGILQLMLSSDDRILNGAAGSEELATIVEEGIARSTSGVRFQITSHGSIEREHQGAKDNSREHFVRVPRGAKTTALLVAMLFPGRLHMR